MSTLKTFVGAGTALLGRKHAARLCWLNGYAGFVARDNRYSRLAVRLSERRHRWRVRDDVNFCGYHQLLHQKANQSKAAASSTASRRNCPLCKPRPSEQATKLHSGEREARGISSVRSGRRRAAVAGASGPLLRRDWARPRHFCAETGLTPPHLH